LHVLDYTTGCTFYYRNAHNSYKYL
jgi:hypothetical protein